MTLGDLVVYGAGGHAKVVLDAATLQGWRIVAILDDDPRASERLGVPVRQPSPESLVELARAARAIVGIGDNRGRARVAERLESAGFSFGSIVHPSTVVASSVTIEPGAFLAAGAIVNAGARIGRHSIVNTGSTVDHDCTIGPFVHLGPGVHLCGNVQVGTGALVGVGAQAIPGVSIGEWAVVGAGAAVVRPVPPGRTVVGVPAREREPTPRGD